MNPRQYQQNLAALRCGQAIGDAAAAATGQVFLQSELSKLDPIVRLPLENFTYMRDIPIDTGGGWIDNHIARNVDFRGEQTVDTGTQSNDIPVIEYNSNQDVWPVYPYEVRVRIPVVESLKMAQTNRSPQDLLDKGVRIHYSKTLDIRTYQGKNNNFGLINNPLVAQTSLPATGTGTPATLFSGKTPQLILQDFNFMATTIWNASGNAPDAMPTRFLVDTTPWNSLTQPMVLGGVGGYASVLEYVKKNYIGAAFGVEPEIYPLPQWLSGAGTGNTSLIVAYKFDKDCLSLGIPQEIQRFGGPLSVVSGAFEVLYLANIGVVKINRPQTVGYFYGA
jgi:hypothetical protein